MGAMNLEARVARLEQLIAHGGAQTWGARPVDDAARAVRGAIPIGIAQFGEWLKAQHQPGLTYVVAGVIRDKASASSIHSWGGDDAPHDLQKIARVCGALASEARLGILRELAKGRRSTADLMNAVGLDRGQLYHHLKELFLQRLVEQPERGAYAATGRGLALFLMAPLLTTLGGCGDPSNTSVSEADLDFGDEAREAESA